MRAPPEARSPQGGRQDKPRVGAERAARRSVELSVLDEKGGLGLSVVGHGSPFLEVRWMVRLERKPGAHRRLLSASGDSISKRDGLAAGAAFVVQTQLGARLGDAPEQQEQVRAQQQGLQGVLGL